jgi:hypothetical protein
MTAGLAVCGRQQARAGAGDLAGLAAESGILPEPCWCARRADQRRRFARDTEDRMQVSKFREISRASGVYRPDHDHVVRRALALAPALALTAVLCGALAGCASGTAEVASGGVAPARTAASEKAVRMLAAPTLPLRPDPAFASLPRYSGTLGGRRIEMKLGPKADDPGGVQGEYNFVGVPGVILVAGDHYGTTLEIEESDDGTHISGNWVGRFNADGSVGGQRLNDDETNPQEFMLRPIARSGGPAPGAAASTRAPGVAPTVPTEASSPNRAPEAAGNGNGRFATGAGPLPPSSEAPAAPVHGVGGISNLTTGE